MNCCDNNRHTAKNEAAERLVDVSGLGPSLFRFNV